MWALTSLGKETKHDFRWNGQGLPARWRDRRQQCDVHLHFVVADGGGYTAVSPLSMYLTGCATPLPYKLPNYKFDAYRTFTNNPICAAMRGHGVTHTRFALEILMEMMGEELGIGPVEIRMRNAIDKIKPGEIYRTINDMTIKTCGMKEAIETLRRQSFDLVITDMRMPNMSGLELLREVKTKFPKQTLSIFVMPPSVEELERRLTGRSTDDAATIKKRVDKAVLELKYADQFDIVLINDILQEAQVKAFNMVSEFIFKKWKSVCFSAPSTLFTLVI